MQQSQSQAHHLTPEEYLLKFRTSHSVITDAHAENTPQDFQTLQRILDIGYNETETSRSLKEKALGELQVAVKKWLFGINPNVSDKCGLEIFGSYRLGVNSSDSDIDAVCIVPPYVERERHFFEDFATQLATNPNITELYPIPTALFPLIKLKLYGVHFDILMSQIPEGLLVENLEFDNPVLDVVEERERKNINGCRIASYLDTRIKNQQVFKITLKAIKMWARNRGVYLQMFSYLGGIGYTVLLAKIMELYPNYSPLKILSRFFYIYSRWTWEIPVILEEESLLESESTEMTIMTPVSPAMNTSHFVSRTTLRIIRREFKEAYKTIEEIQKGLKPWNALFAPVDILKKYKHFLEISIMANKKDNHIIWKGHVESKFRKLLKLLEGGDYFNIEVHPFPKEFTSRHSNYHFCSKYYIGIRCKSHNIEDDTKEVDFTQPIRDFLQIIEKYDDIGKIPEDINIGIGRVPAETLGEQIANNPSTFYKHE